MTEPLLFALTSLMVLHLVEWATAEAPTARRAVGWTIVAACLTRYEAWPIAGAAIVAAAYVKWRRGLPAVATVHEAARLAAFALATVLFFMGMSFASTGEWFVTGGFYVPDPKLQGQALAVLREIRDGGTLLGGRTVMRLGLAAFLILIGFGLWRRSLAACVLAVTLAASIALPFYAFYSGHPFRIRYEVPLLLGCAVMIGTAVGLMRRFAAIGAVPILWTVLLQVGPFDGQAPMIVEAQLDRQNGIGRRAVTECLERSYDGTTIMASMGSLAHYMQELSLAGFDLADFIHEGSGPIWERAYYFEPSLFVGWVLVEEKAEGGDMLARKQKSWPGFLAAYDRVCEGGNVALYRRASTK